MSNQFNPKLYQKKDRVYSKIQKHISKCWRWSAEFSEYRFQYFEVRKKGKVRREDKKTFQDLASAKSWLYNTIVVDNSDRSPKLKDVLQQWKLSHYPRLRRGTQIFYDKMTLQFGNLLNLSINQITPVCIDEWIGELKKSLKRRTRASFNKELDALKTVLSFYKENIDTPYELPIKKRHRDLAFVKEKIVKNEVITEEQFLKFRNELFKSKNGLIFATLATFQFYHALRISEAAGVFKKDFNFDIKSGANTFVIQRSLKWEREKDSVPTIEENFKNSKITGTKSSVLHGEVAKLIQQLVSNQQSTSEALFAISGELLTYRQIQHEYNKAMEAAGLDFKSTHMLRKGGATDIYNKTGNVAMVQAVLGVSSMEIAQVYAKPQEVLLQNYYKETYKK